MTRTDNLIKIFLFICNVCMLAFAGVDALKNPAYNGDIYSYSKVVLSLDNGYTNQNLLIRDSILTAEIPVERYNVLKENRDKGKISSRDINNGVSFAAIKPLYIGLVYVAYKAGMKLTDATVLPSALSYIAMGILLLFWLLRYLPVLPAFIITTITMRWKIIVKIAAMSSPDALSSFFIFLSLFYLIEEKLFWHFFIAILLSVFTRIDNSIYVLFLLTILLFIKDVTLKISLRTYLKAVGILGVSYLIIMFIATFYGWDMLFFSSYFRDQQVDSKKMFQQDVYFDTLRYTLNEAINKTKGLKFAILGIVLITFKKGTWKIDEWIAALFVILFVLRTFLFPHTTDRFYIGFYLVFILLFVRVYTSFISEYLMKAKTNK